MAMNTICYVEWWSTDFERTKSFFEGLFGWKFEMSGEEYMFFSTPEGGPGGGFHKCRDLNPGVSARVYIHVDDVNAYVEKVKELGGKIVNEKTEIPEMGWYADFKDPDGNIIGLWQGRGEG